MDAVSTYGKMDQGTKGSGKIIKMKALEDSLVLAAILIQVNLETTCNMDTVSKNGWTEHHTTGNFMKSKFKE